MNRIITTVCFFLAITSFSFAQGKSFLSYYELRDVYSVSPGSFRSGLYGFTNPAILSYNHAPLDIMLKASGQTGTIEDFNRWGFFMGAAQGGFGGLFTKQIDANGNLGQIADYRISSGFGDKVFNLGYMFGWSGGDGDEFNRSRVYGIGTIIRPFKELSFGAHWTKAWENSDAEYVAELSVRPIGDMPLTFFADAAMFDDQNIDNMRWSAGASLEFVDGIRVHGRYFDNDALMVGLDISFGTIGIGVDQHVENPAPQGSNVNSSFQTFTYRFGGLDRTILDWFSSKKDYVVMDLGNTIKYQRYQFFDNSITLLSVLNTLDDIIDNDDIGGIIINTNKMSANMATLWEIRTKLQEVKDAGKKIIMFVDNAPMTKYYFASIADHIVMDNLGMITMEGFVMGRSYYKDMLEKANLGYEEIRLFKYKSAVENFANSSMSEGDREQRQELINDWYQITKTGISDSRGFSSEEFDSFVNEDLFYTYEKAKSKGLVDTNGRWNDYEDIVKELVSDIDDIYPVSNLYLNPEPFDDNWGGKSEKVAVIYVVGVCAMDQGIKARTLIKDVERAVKDESVKAIVLRVDSPGGDAMASDYIAKVVRDNKDKKPIIVSQGMVAASGGYWLSMDADEIVSTPVTVTGSIGVIAGFLHNAGFADSIGINTEYVKVGKYADINYPVTLPLIPIGLPNRSLNNDERGKFENMISEMYDVFVNAVAEGRNMEVDAVKEVAQGRVWTGLDAKENKLVDRLGTLADAIELAKEKAGIAEDEEVSLVELPKPELFNFNQFLPSLIGFNLNSFKEDIDHLKMRFDYNGKPMTIIPLDYSDVEPMKLR